MNIDIDLALDMYKEWCSEVKLPLIAEYKQCLKTRNEAQRVVSNYEPDEDKYYNAFKEMLDDQYELPRMAGRYYNASDIIEKMDYRHFAEMLDEYAWSRFEDDKSSDESYIEYLAELEEAETELAEVISKLEELKITEYNE